MSKNNIFRNIIFIIYPISILTAIICGAIINLKLPYDLIFIFPPNKDACELFIKIFQLPLSIFITSLFSWCLLFLISIIYIPQQKRKKSFFSPEDFDPNDTYDVYSHLSPEQKEQNIKLLNDIKSDTSNKIWATLLRLNGFLIAIFSIVMSLNKDNISPYILFISIFFIISIFISSYFVLNIQYKIRRQAWMNLFLFDKNLPIKKEKSVKILTSVVTTGEELMSNEKKSTYWIAIAIVLLLTLFTFIYK